MLKLLQEDHVLTLEYIVIAANEHVLARILLDVNMIYRFF